MSSKDRSSEGSPATEDTLESYEQDEIHRAASVMCDALESLEERRSSATPSRARSRGAERRNGSENTAVKIARAFFMAATVKSGDDEDILPQEDGPDEKLSVYYLFSELFPDQVTNKEGSDGGSKNGLTRLQVGRMAPAAARDLISRPGSGLWMRACAPQDPRVKPVWFCVMRPLLSCNFCDILATTPPRPDSPGPDCFSGLAVQQNWVRNVFQGTVASRAGPPSGILPALRRIPAHHFSLSETCTHGT